LHLRHVNEHSYYCYCYCYCYYYYYCRYTMSHSEDCLSYSEMGFVLGSSLSDYANNAKLQKLGAKSVASDCILF